MKARRRDLCGPLVEYTLIHSFFNTNKNLSNSKLPCYCSIGCSKSRVCIIDDAVKKEICFGETLIISCGHYEGDIGEEQSDSEWSCNDTTESVASEEIKDDKMFEVVDRVEDEAAAEESEEANDDFHFYFFPDCKKPLATQDSKASLMIVNGMPKINPAAKRQTVCTCPVDKKGECECNTHLPCKCGAKTDADCKCSQLKNICICDDSKPKPVCSCKGSDVCLCHPGKMQPICTCDQIDKPCICHAPSGKFPYPICPCKFKPKFIKDLSAIGEEGEHTNEEEQNNTEEEEEKQPCTCQKTEPELLCLCAKGNDCSCNADACVCGVQKSCICEPTDTKEPICKVDDSKNICECKISQKCLCEEQSEDCTCFPKKVCTCGDPENCKCLAICNCIEPCICDTAVDTPLECYCKDKSKQELGGLLCTCPKEESKKLKRVRAGKHGYRWCHDVDPRHTYFDYAYDRHNKLEDKEEQSAKVNILGLHDGKKEEDICGVHGIKAPPYEKKIRKPSLDCCSSVGGISICVETLGEDKDKFLVQIVSHSSKEGAKSGTKLVSILDTNLHTMEENRTEHLTNRKLTKERKSYIAICENGYYNKVTRISGDRTIVKRHYHTFEDAKNFLLEGANVVLLRYFGLRRHRGNVKTDTVMMNGTICESIYVCNGVSQAVVNGKPLFVVKVERHIIEPSGLLHQTLTVLTLRGYIVSHEWADSMYMFHINPLLNVIPEKDEIEAHVPLREKWREDLQLLSDYLDFKSTRTSEGGRYVVESGALTGTIRDYLQALLLLRPQDALHFTRHYFSAALSALDLPHDEYFDPAAKHVRYYFFEE